MKTYKNPTCFYSVKLQEDTVILQILTVLFKKLSPIFEMELKIVMCKITCNKCKKTSGAGILPFCCQIFFM